jgi:hypothetical protein
MSARRQATADRAAGAGAGPRPDESSPAQPASDATGQNAQGRAEGGSGQNAQGRPAAGSGQTAQGRAAGGSGQSARGRAAGGSGRSRGRGTAAPGGSAPGAEAKPASSQSSRERLPTRVPASQQRPGRPGARRDKPARPGQGGKTPAETGFGNEAADLAPGGLSARLMALARIIQIGSARSGRDGFSKKLLTDAEDVLNRAGERMRLSSSHTVVVLAGGTGSGKSSLFNRLAGADFSTVGVTRPVTREAHACIWGATGSGAMLDWLNVPARYRYSRASALDKGEADLAGLVLLDLPDHDSVMSHSGDLVDTLVSMADVMIWVLDPQKYADAAVHRRFLVPMAGHADVLAVVLNQSDLLDPAQVDDCASDLRRLLDSENLHDVPILVTSAVSGDGVDSLRKLLLDGVVARRAAAVRIAADVDRVVTGFTPYAGLPAAGSDGAAEGSADSTAGAGDGGVGAASQPAAPERAAAIPASSKKQLAGRFEAAAGVPAITDSLRNARELRAVDFVGWPVAWIIQRLTGREPARKVRLSMLWDDLRSVSAGPAGAQQAEIDNALTKFGDGLADPLPKPWSHTVRTAIRSRADRIPAAVGGAIGDALPAEDSVRWWWRLAGLWQGLLLGLAALAAVWLVVITIFGVFHAVSGVAFALRDTTALPWIAGAGVAALALGAGTAALSMSSVRRSAVRENARVAKDMRGRIGEVAQEMVILPAEQELSEYDRYRDEVRIARNGIDTPADPPAERA